MKIDMIRNIIPKVKNRLRSEKNRLWKYVDVGKISLKNYIPFKDADELKERLAEMLGVFTPALLEGISSEEKETILTWAEHGIRHEYDLLGSGLVHLEPVDWHIDFKSGFRWEKRYYRELAGKKGADIKVPWELSRCQHLLWIGEAYLLTGEEKYAQEVIDEIKWWIDDNPLMYSINWKCAMDVAYRAVNWMYALNMVAEYSGFSNDFGTKVSRSLWQHGFYIWNNLEKLVPYSNNHYFSDIVGLLYLGELFSSARKGRKWGNFAIDEYYKEIRTQTLPSGVNYEKSISYHRLMTEMTSYPIYMLQRCGKQVPDDIIELVKKSYAFVNNYTKPNGFAPLVGDNDDGRFLPFVMRDFRFHEYLNDINSIENRLISAGLEKRFVSKTPQRELYDDAGFAVCKRGDAYLFVSNGEYSKYPSEADSSFQTHTHNDSLSFELSIGEVDFIVDPGTYLYTPSPKDRNSFRSSVKHNTIVVDQEEQNLLPDTAMFIIERNNHKERLAKTNEKLVGAYQTIKGGAHHQRLFELFEDKLIITDSLIKNGNNHVAIMSFHFAEGINPLFKDNNLIVETPVYKVIIELSGVGDSKIIDDTVSPSYGVLKSSKTLVNTFTFNNTIKINTTIKWTRRSNTK